MSQDSRIVKVKGCAVSVPGDEVDTDRIMPARYLKCVTFDKLGEVVFQDERYDPSGKPKGHPLDDPRFRGAVILVVNKNFGCGSSREHAPQGILRSGLKAIVGESFAEIFSGNCTAIGLPLVTAASGDIKKLEDFVRGNPSSDVDVNLEKKTVSFGNDTIPVEMREAFRKVLLDGTWDTASTLLAAKDEIEKTAERLPYVRVRQVAP